MQIYFNKALSFINKMTNGILIEDTPDQNNLFTGCCFSIKHPCVSR